jgi:hypothetical protein
MPGLMYLREKVSRPLFLSFFPDPFHCVLIVLNVRWDRVSRSFSTARPSRSRVPGSLVACTCESRFSSSLERFPVGPTHKIEKADAASCSFVQQDHPDVIIMRGFCDRASFLTQTRIVFPAPSSSRPSPLSVPRSPGHPATSSPPRTTPPQRTFCSSLFTHSLQHPVLTGRFSSLP